MVAIGYAEWAMKLISDYDQIITKYEQKQYILKGV